MKKGIFLLILILFLSAPVYAQEKDLSLVAEGKYFSVYASKDLDITSLLTKLNFNYFLHIDRLNTSRGRDLKAILAQTMDAIFLEVSDILDIHIYSFHGDIKVLSGKADITSIFRNYFGKSFSERSFYLPEKNTIYISFPDLALGMLGHEMGHAIICHYFVVPPPAKVQEVLSGYVEYNLRKSIGTLPE